MPFLHSGRPSAISPKICRVNLNLLDVLHHYVVPGLLGSSRFFSIHLETMSVLVAVFGCCPFNVRDPATAIVCLPENDSVVAIPVLHLLVADSSATCSKPMHSFRIDQNFIFSLIPSDYFFLSCPLFSEFFDLCRCAAFLSSYCLSSLHST